MKSDLTIKNRYCTIPQAKFRKWDEMDVLLWKLGKNDSRRRSGVYYLNAYKDINELPEQYSAEIMHFFEVYKQLENKKTEVKEMCGRETAEKIIEKCIKNYNEKFLR